jgi:CBS domain-containing protein
MGTTIGQLIRVTGSTVHTLPSDATLGDALRMMARYEIGSVVVADGVDNVVGIFSERDYARKSVASDCLSMNTPIRDLMTTSVITVGRDHTVQECMELVTERRVRHLPVMDEDRVLIGLVSIGDLVKASIAEKEALINEKQSLVRNLEGYITGAVC